eukprot:gene3824-4082_t
MTESTAASKEAAAAAPWGDARAWEAMRVRGMQTDMTQGSILAKAACAQQGSHPCGRPALAALVVDDDCGSETSSLPATPTRRGRMSLSPRFKAALVNFNTKVKSLVKVNKGKRKDSDSQSTAAELAVLGDPAVRLLSNSGVREGSSSLLHSLIGTPIPSAGGMKAADLGFTASNSSSSQTSSICAGEGCQLKLSRVVETLDSAELYCSNTGLQSHDKQDDRPLHQEQPVSSSDGRQSGCTNPAGPAVEEAPGDAALPLPDLDKAESTGNNIDSVSAPVQDAKPADGDALEAVTFCTQASADLEPEAVKASAQPAVDADQRSGPCSAQRSRAVGAPVRRLGAALRSSGRPSDGEATSAESEVLVNSTAAAAETDGCNAASAAVYRKYGPSLIPSYKSSRGYPAANSTVVQDAEESSTRVAASLENKAAAAHAVDRSADSLPDDQSSSSSSTQADLSWSMLEADGWNVNSSRPADNDDSKRDPTSSASCFLQTQTLGGADDVAERIDLRECHAGNDGQVARAPLAQPAADHRAGAARAAAGQGASRAQGKAVVVSSKALGAAVKMRDAPAGLTAGMVLLTCLVLLACVGLHQAGRMPGRRGQDCTLFRAISSNVTGSSSQSLLSGKTQWRQSVAAAATRVALVKDSLQWVLRVSGPHRLVVSEATAAPANASFKHSLQLAGVRAAAHWWPGATMTAQGAAAPDTAGTDTLQDRVARALVAAVGRWSAPSGKTRVAGTAQDSTYEHAAAAAAKGNMGSTAVDKQLHAGPADAAVSAKAGMLEAAARQLMKEAAIPLAGTATADKLNVLAAINAAADRKAGSITTSGHSMGSQATLSLSAAAPGAHETPAKAQLISLPDHQAAVVSLGLPAKPASTEAAAVHTALQGIGLARATTKASAAAAAGGGGGGGGGMGGGITMMQISSGSSATRHAPDAFRAHTGLQSQQAWFKWFASKPSSTSLLVDKTTLSTDEHRVAVARVAAGAMDLKAAKPPSPAVAPVTESSMASPTLTGSSSGPVASPKAARDDGDKKYGQRSKLLKRELDSQVSKPETSPVPSALPVKVEVEYQSQPEQLTLEANPQQQVAELKAASRGTTTPDIAQTHTCLDAWRQLVIVAAALLDIKREQQLMIDWSCFDILDEEIELCRLELSGESTGAFLSIKGYYTPDKWEVYWTTRLACHKAFPVMKPGQQVNCLPGAQAMALKRDFVHTWQQAYGEAAFNYIPRSYLLPEQYWLWRNNIKASSFPPDTKWVLKANMHRGQGVSVVPQHEALSKALEHTRDGSAAGAGGGEGAGGVRYHNVVVQQYLASQLVIAGRSSYLRLWLLVTSINPLRAYLFQGGFVIFGKQKGQSKGLTATASGSAGEAAAAAGGSNSSSSSTDDLIVNLWIQDRNKSSIWSLQQLELYLNAHPETSASLVLAAALPKMRAAAAAASAPQQGMFEQFGLDFVLDAHLRPWLLE